MWQKTLSVVSGMAVLAGLAGCGTGVPDWDAINGYLAGRYTPEQRAWRAAKKKDSPETYRRFAESYPDGRYAEAAKWQVDSLEWSGAMTSGLLRRHVSYLDEHSFGRHAGDARDFVRLRLRQVGAVRVPPDSRFYPPVSPDEHPYWETVETTDLGDGRLWRHKTTYVHSDGAWYRVVGDVR